LKTGAVYLNDTCLLPRVWRAVSAWERTRGLLGRAPLSENEGMLIGDCRLVHTFGMGYALDLAFLDHSGKVRKLVSGLRPARFAGSFDACETLELAPGTLARIGVREGDRLEWRSE
jgi:uncharacterized membrane protein (UPF0127 family)